MAAAGAAAAADGVVEDEEEDTIRHASSFATLVDNNDQEEEEEEVSSSSPPPPPPTPAQTSRGSSKNKNKKKKKKKNPTTKQTSPATEEDEEAVLAAAMREAAVARDSPGEAPRPSYLRFDVSRLDADRELRSRLGESSARRRLDRKRRGVFPEAFDGDFGEPPSFARGGARWDGADAVASDDWARASRELAACRGDPNELATLCARRPFHAPSLVATAVAACALGRADLAEALVRRALRAYTTGDAARHKVLAGTFRANEASAAPLFEAAFLAARLAAMKGAPETAANLFRFCLSLDPGTDPKGVLLRLPADLLDADDLDALDDLVAASPDVPCACLCRSLAFLRKADRPAAIDALADAFLKFPHLLLCLLDACEIVADSSNFRDVLWHDHFRKHNWMNNQKNSYAALALPRALDVACLRTRRAWKRNVDILLAAAKRVVDDPVRESDRLEKVRHVDRVWSTGPMVKYARCPVSDFQDTFEHLGPDAAAGLDDSLLAPEAAARYRDLRTNRGGLVPDHRGGDVLLMDLLAHLPPDLQAHYQAQAEAGVPPAELEASLLQLLA
ncbi:hypothetical protein CTAYLR_000436 [Chrysophaeum taylorii]|uniref:Transcription factor 25 n=1 Tax=Chrysophaeum taylorii TaxID=2483200 RepID=A0AAD7UG47_9STRA|nr:hypothetical protein CTAYLR_000436 [Chrysophaeum taylorii]